MHDQLTNNGAVVHSYLMCGATAHDWLAKSTVSCGRGERHEKGAPVINTQQLLPTYFAARADRQDGHHRRRRAGRELEPDHAWVRQEVHTLAGKIAASHISCVWIGPTWGQNKQPYPTTDASIKELTQLLSESVSPSASFSTRRGFRPAGRACRLPTGTHLLDGYRRWEGDCRRRRPVQGPGDAGPALEERLARDPWRRRLGEDSDLIQRFAAEVLAENPTHRRFVEAFARASLSDEHRRELLTYIGCCTDRGLPNIWRVAIVRSPSTSRWSRYILNGINTGIRRSRRWRTGFITTTNT